MLEQRLQDPELTHAEIAVLGKEFAALGGTVELISRRGALLKEIGGLEVVEREAAGGR